MHLLLESTPSFLFLIFGRVVDARLPECLFPLHASATLAAMLFATLVAGVCRGIVDAQPFADGCYLRFRQRGVGGVDADVVVCAVAHGFGHRCDERLSAVGIDGVVACMVGDEHRFQSPALSQSAGDGKHDAVAEGDYRRFHVLVLIVPFGNGVRALQQRRLEIFAHELERNDDVLDAEQLAVVGGKVRFPFVVVTAVVECDCEGDMFFVVVQQGHAVHASRQDNDGVFFCHTTKVRNNPYTDKN